MGGWVDGETVDEGNVLFSLLVLCLFLLLPVCFGKLSIVRFCEDVLGYGSFYFFFFYFFRSTGKIVIESFCF